MKTVEFGELFQFMRNGMSIKQDKSGDGLPISRIETIADSSIDPARVGYASLSFDTCKDWLLQEGDILFSHINSVEHIGKCAVYRGVPAQLVHGMNLLCFRPDPTQVTPEFAKYLIRSTSFRNRLSNFVNKAVNQASVSIGNLRTIPVRIPPLEEQRRIAAILDQAETLRTQRRTALALLDSLTQSLFLDMFGDPVANDQGWPDSLTLGEVADIASGVTKGRKLDGKVTREVPYLAVANVQDKTLRLEGLKTIEATEDEISRYRLQKDDLLLTEGGDPDKLGRGTLWNEELPECIHQNHIFRVRLTHSALHPLFLNWLVGSTRGKNYFLRSAKQTTGIASINMTQLRSFPLLLPPLPLQQTFATRIAAIEALKTTHRRALAALDALFASLQQRAFAGQL